jgi:AraC-type DNA-binding domain-containing proteins
MDRDDLVSDIFATLRLASSIYFRAALSGDCAVMVPPEGRQIRFHLVLQGACRVEVGDEAVSLSEGDIALVPRGAAQVVAHGTSRPPAVPLPRLIAEGALAEGRLTAGTGGDRALLLCGFLAFDEGISHPALEALPPLLAVRLADLDQRPASAAALRLLDLEARLGADGARAILPRLVEIVLIQALRDLVAAEGPEGRGFLAALADRQLARALTALHRAPDRDWTVKALAAAAGMSRTRFAARFLALTGTPPMTYLTRWRLMRSRALLSTTRLSIEDVALACGYRSLPSFNRRFKAEFGIGPGTWRRQAAG